MNALKVYLEQNSLTGEGFARDSGLKQYEISRIVTGKRKPSVRIARIIEKTTNGDLTRQQLRPDVFENLSTGADA